MEGPKPYAQPQLLLAFKRMFVGYAGDTWSKTGSRELLKPKLFSLAWISTHGPIPWLGLPVSKTSHEILGGGGQAVQAFNKICALRIFSPDFETKITSLAIVLHQLTQCLPSFKVKYYKIGDYFSLPFANPFCFEPLKIDMINDIILKILKCSETAVAYLLKT